MTKIEMDLKVKKIEKKETWSENIDGEEMWTTEFVDSAMGIPKLRMTDFERPKGISRGEIVKVIIQTKQTTLLDNEQTRDTESEDTE